MQINNYSSPSFTGIKQQNMERITGSLKKGLLKSFRKNAGSLAAFADKHNTDVLFIKPKIDTLQTVLNADNSELLDGISAAAHNMASRFGESFKNIAFSETSKVANATADAITAGADEVTKEMAKKTAKAVVLGNEIVLDAKIADEQQLAIQECIDKAKENIAGDMTDPFSDTFAIKISGKKKGSVEQIIEDVKMPHKKWFGKNSMKKLFKEIKAAVRDVEELNKLNDVFK